MLLPVVSLGSGYALNVDERTIHGPGGETQLRRP